MINTLKRRGHIISYPEKQVEILTNNNALSFPAFDDVLISNNKSLLTANAPEILQVNLGKMCNQTCKHCHVDAGPDRNEIMTRETMGLVIKCLEQSNISTVDLTGGAPELNPHFRWFVTELHKRGRKLMVRCNLTIIVSNSRFNDLPDFYKENEMEVIASLPYFSSGRTDAQRGDGVFERSIKALKMLNHVGYGKTNTGMILNLIYNPTGAFLPGNQDGLEREFKVKLKEGYGIEFNNLFTITNLPISRFLDFLVSSGNYQSYMSKLVSSFNPHTTNKLMCKNTISVGWSGYLYDCDFNQMLELKISGKDANHISNLNWDNLPGRRIKTNRHCFGCTAGSGSSCGGSLS